MGRLNQSLRPVSLRHVPTGMVYILAALPLLWLALLAATDGLGPDPVRRLEQELGLWGLRLLVAGLAITPLRRTGLNLIRWRRALGRMGFLYIGVHLACWLALDMGLWLDQALRDIARRPYITVGMAGFVLMVPLALTSGDAALRQMGAARWRRLHRLTYPAVLLGALHYTMIGKTWDRQALSWLALVLALLALRLLPRRARAAQARIGGQDGGDSAVPGESGAGIGEIEGFTRGHATPSGARLGRDGRVAGQNHGRMSRESAHRSKIAGPESVDNP